MQLFLLPVEPRINGACVEGFVWVSDTLSILGEIKAPVMDSTSKSVIVSQDTPFQHVGVGVGAVSVKVKSLGRGLDTKPFGRVDVDIEPRAVGTLQPLGPQLCFLGA